MNKLFLKIVSMFFFVTVMQASENTMPSVNETCQKIKCEIRKKRSVQKMGEEQKEEGQYNQITPPVNHVQKESCCDSVCKPGPAYWLVGFQMWCCDVDSSDEKCALPCRNKPCDNIGEACVICPGAMVLCCCQPLWDRYCLQEK
ncbi:MAG: hypothetical protein CL947_02730 [Epsilonproteobacteria bacterium]|nr:hypothetical protein [Campylobacterota bacterium]